MDLCRRGDCSTLLHPHTGGAGKGWATGEQGARGCAKAGRWLCSWGPDLPTLLSCWSRATFALPLGQRARRITWHRCWAGQRCHQPRSRWDVQQHLELQAWQEQHTAKLPCLLERQHLPAKRLLHGQRLLAMQLSGLDFFCLFPFK